AIDHAGKNVAAEFVGPEPVQVAGRLQACGEIQLRGIMRCNQRSEDGKDHEQNHKHNAKRRQWIAQNSSHEGGLIVALAVDVVESSVPSAVADGLRRPANGPLPICYRGWY